MPLTVPAHQAFVLPLKIGFPDRFDGTALFIGAAAPDLAYSFGSWSHTFFGIVIWAVPFTLAACALLRRGSALGVFAHFADLGPFRIRSYRVLASRSPASFVTLYSSLVGSVSHVLIDAFTHKGRWGSDWLGTSEMMLDLPVVGEQSLARVFQYVGHSLGSLVAIVLLLHIGNRRLLERWYSEQEVDRARAVHVTFAQRLIFWTLVGIIAAAAVLLGVASGRYWVFPLLTGTAIGLVLVGSLRLYGTPPAPTDPSITAPMVEPGPALSPR